MLQSSGTGGAGSRGGKEAAGVLSEDELETLLRGKQALMDKLQEDDPLKKLISNHDQIVKKHQGGTK
jgi:hypothetical protein